MLTPLGPKPVDPWGPGYKKLAKDAIQPIVQNVRVLQKAGTEMFSARIKEVSSHPAPIPDESDEAEEVESAKGRNQKKQ